MVFCMAAWWKMGVLLGNSKQTGSKKQGSAGREATKKRHRLLRIAIMTSFCLLVMMGALLATSSKLDEFNRTADLSLACFKETTFTRNFPAYGLTEDKAKVEVCSSEGATFLSDDNCINGCFWFPAVTDKHLACIPAGGYERDDGTWIESLEDLADNYDPAFGSRSCDCACDAFVEVERPRCIFGIGGEYFHH